VPRLEEKMIFKRKWQGKEQYKKNNIPVFPAGVNEKQCKRNRHQEIFFSINCYSSQHNEQS
jgi:hypothetical protein